MSQAFAKESGKTGQGVGGENPKGGAKGKEGGANKNWSKVKCFICGGLHLARHRGKEQCPNTVAEASGTVETNKKNCFLYNIA